LFAQDQAMAQSDRLRSVTDSAVGRHWSESNPLAREMPTHGPRKVLGHPSWIDDRVQRFPFHGRLWLHTELLGWATKGQQLPPLLTSGSSTVFGDETTHDELRLGGRLTIGWWCDWQKINGIEGYYFGLDGKDIEFLTSGNGIDNLARPTVDVLGNPTEVLIDVPGEIDGIIDFKVDMEFSGAGAIWRHALSGGSHHRVDLLAGYRYARLFDQLVANESLTVLASPNSSRFTAYPAGTTIDRFDAFRSENEFHGGEVGLMGHWQKSRWSFQMLGKVALGGTRSNVTIDGGTVVVDPTTGPPPVPELFSGGVLALSSNVGDYTEQELAVMSEVGVSMKYDLTHSLRASLGYTFIYWSRVQRALERIDLTVDDAQLPPNVATGSETRPSFSFDDTSFWAQGLNFGLEYQF
jgi:hypothetical protein